MPTALRTGLYRLYGRIRGDHHIVTQDSVQEILNLQAKGAKAKSY